MKTQKITNLNFVFLWNILSASWWNLVESSRYTFQFSQLRDIEFSRISVHELMLYFRMSTYTCQFWDHKPGHSNPQPVCLHPLNVHRLEQLWGGIHQGDWESSSLRRQSWCIVFPEKETRQVSFRTFTTKGHSPRFWLTPGRVINKNTDTRNWPRDQHKPNSTL